MSCEHDNIEAIIKDDIENLGWGHSIEFWFICKDCRSFLFEDRLGVTKDKVRR